MPHDRLLMDQGEHYVPYPFFHTLKFMFLLQIHALLI